ncbi:MAG: hypothetical protein AAF944_19910 [Bacteroidota bacterium]
MRYLTAIILLYLVASCTETTKNLDQKTDEMVAQEIQIETEDILQTDTLNSISAEGLQELLDIPVRGKFKEVYSGFYSYKLSSESKRKLHGQFFFSYYDSSSYFMVNGTDTIEVDNMYSVSRIEYSGKFVDGEKQGEFKEDLYFTDGVDLYSEWKVTINFNDNECTSGRYEGATGHAMPDTLLVYQSLDSCTFDYIANRAWKDWQSHYNEQLSKSLPVHEILHGQWFSEGNEGVVPHWTEFDSFKSTYTMWLVDEEKPEDSNYTYKLISNDLLEISDISYRDIRQFAFDSINWNYIDLAPLGPSAGKLIYQRKKYKLSNGSSEIIFFRPSEQEFDSLVNLSEYQGLYEASSDFGFYINSTLKQLKQRGVQASVTDERIIRVGNREIDKFDHAAYGLILVKSDSISVHSGVMTDVGYMQLISEFLNVR